MSLEWESSYHDERNKLTDGEQDYSKSYDKYVLTLSGGALALSMTFIHDIVGAGPVRATALVILAWISFTLSVAAALVSIHQSGPLFRSFRDILDRHADHAGDNFSWTRVREDQLKCRRLILMDWLNYGSLVLFLLGVILLLSFTGCNLKGDGAMQDASKPQDATRETSSYGAKPAPASVDVGIPSGIIEGGKPAFAPVDVAPKQPLPSRPSPAAPGTGGKPPLGPVSPQPTPPSGPPPSQPAPSQPKQGE